MDFAGKLRAERAGIDESRKKGSESCEKQTTKYGDSEAVVSVLIPQLHQCIELLVREEQNGRYPSVECIPAATFTSHTWSGVI